MSSLSSEQIESNLKAAESDPSLDDTQKLRIRELYDQATKWLQQASEARAQIMQLKTLIQDAPERIKAIREGTLHAVPAMPDLASVLAADRLGRMEPVLTQEQLALLQAREALRNQEADLSRLLVGGKGLSEEISAKIKALDQIDTDLKIPAPNEPPAVVQAQRMMLSARRQLRQTELELLKQRLGSQDMLTNLTQAERDYAEAEIAQRQLRVDSLNQAVLKLRETQARQARQEAELLKSRTESLPASLKKIAVENTGYRLELEELIGLERSVAGELEAARRGLDEIKGDFDHTRERVGVVGASEAIGKMLKRRRQELPSPQRYRRSSTERGIEISRATDRQIDIDELLRQRSNIQMVVAEVLEPLPESQRPQFEQQATELTRTRRDALNELQKVYGRYIGQITSLDLAERQLVEVAQTFIDYIDDQLIWTPGPDFSKLISPASLGGSFLWLLDADHWLEVVHDGRSLVTKRLPGVLLLLGLFLLLLRKRRIAQMRLHEIAKKTRKIRTDSFRLTLLALFHTLVIVSAWPLLLIGAGWLIKTLPSAAPFTLAVSEGLIKAGLIVASIRFLMQICAKDGVGDRHLRWNSAISEVVVREFAWLLPLAVPLGFLVAATAGDGSQNAQSLGRLSFILLMAVSTVFVYRLLRRRGALMLALEGEAGSLLLQLHFLWFPLVFLLPLAFGIGSALGYYYTALHLEQRAEQTFWFFIGLFLLKELLLRWLYIAERRLRLEDAVRRRDELRAQRAQSEELHEDEKSAFSLEIPEVNFNQLSEQNKRLVRAGFLFSAVLGVWSIWSDLLPALGFLNTTQLPFHASRIVDGIAKEVPVTLGDFTMGLIMLAITVLAAKNIPGVLEITLLQRLPLDPGARYAITSLSQYTIAGVGVLVAFSTLGLQWSSVQWLVAALSVGLGFGLQEIVANFISGIILLFERPIRVGDVVTIDNTTGVVSRIRIRATTITNYDKQELLIPNKEFITGRVINWTLTDKTNRVIVTVGVAYGTDVSKAMALMLEAAEENENVLDEPKPVTSFEAFGDNALTLLLRSYLGSIDNRLATITALHQAINDKFITAGIEISFPQRDVHLDFGKPLDVRLHQVAPTALDTSAAKG